MGSPWLRATCPSVTTGKAFGRLEVRVDAQMVLYPPDTTGVARCSQNGLLLIPIVYPSAQRDRAVLEGDVNTLRLPIRAPLQRLLDRALHHLGLHRRGGHQDVVGQPTHSPEIADHVLRPIAFHP